MGDRARGVKAIRTLSAVLGTGVHSKERHVQQFQLASLELERARRTREKQATLRRLNQIDTRLGEIDELVNKHQQALGLRSVDGQSQAGEVPRNNGDAAANSRRVVVRY